MVHTRLVHLSTPQPKTPSLTTTIDRTLQELIAPRIVSFYGKHWKFIGTSKRLVRTIAEYSNIHADMLSGKKPLDGFSIAQRMSWAAFRQTSRIEDQAYSLLGIFGVNMPMLYGERERAFTRLQEEIVRSSTDQSIFAWRVSSPACQYFSDVSSLLAKSPTDFRHGDVIYHQRDFQDRSMIEPNQRGFDATLPVIKFRNSSSYALLNCTWKELDKTKRVALRIRPLSISSKDPPYVVAPSQDPANLGRLELLDDFQSEAHMQYHTITVLKDIYARDMYQSGGDTGLGMRPEWLNLCMLDDSRVETASVEVDSSEQFMISGISTSTTMALISAHDPLRIAVVGDGSTCIRINVGRGVYVTAVATLGRAYLPSSTELLPYEAELTLVSPRGSSAAVGRCAVRRCLWPIELTYPLEYGGGVLRARLCVPSTDGRQHAWLEFGVYG